jgi:hypothetical protein
VKHEHFDHPFSLQVVCDTCHCVGVDETGSLLLSSCGLGAATSVAKAGAELVLAAVGMFLVMDASSEPRFNFQPRIELKSF